MFNHDVYDLTQRLQYALYRGAVVAYSARLTESERDIEPEIEPILQLRRGFAESPAWVMVQVVEFLPEPLTVEKFRVRAVYSAPGLVRAILELLASEKWLDRRGDDYHLTDAGRRVIDRLKERQQQLLASFMPVDSVMLDRAENLARRVIDASMEGENPPGAWCIQHSRSRDPGNSASVVHRLVQYGADFNAFRDDAHMVAYRPFEVEGHVWEAFSFVFRGEAHDADSLFDTLSHRGFSRLEWDAALANLENRGWIRATVGGLEVTVSGREVWKEVEQKTNMYFFNPWLVLSADERNELIELMRQICDSCLAALETA